jgi:hypothetical protein
MGVRLGRVWWIFSDGVAEPDFDAGDVDGALVDELAFVVAGGHGAVLAQLAEGAFDGVALLVRDRIGRGRAPALPRRRRLRA